MGSSNQRISILAVLSVDGSAIFEKKLNGFQATAKGSFLQGIPKVSTPRIHLVALIQEKLSNLRMISKRSSL